MFFSEKCWVLKYRFLAFPRGPGGFRELREAGRKHFHRSWYLLVPVVTSYDQKTLGGEFFRPGTVQFGMENSNLQSRIAKSFLCRPVSGESWTHFNTI